MPQSSSLNRRIVLASRPRGEPADSDFRLETDAVPEPGPGQLLRAAGDQRAHGGAVHGRRHAAACALRFSSVRR